MKMRINPDDIVGRRFGRLIVLEYAGRKQLGKGKPEHVYKVQCDCGTVKEVARRNLQNGGTISCGCHRDDANGLHDPDDIVGKRFGRLTVLEYAGHDENAKGHPPVYRCKCDCGKEIVVRRWCLISGQTSSCGCLQRETAGKRSVSLSAGQLYRKFGKNRRQILNMVFDTYKLSVEDQKKKLYSNCINDLKIGQMLCDVYQDIFPNRVEDIALYSRFFQEQLETFIH